jgi:hypothetical protein
MITEQKATDDKTTKPSSGEGLVGVLTDIHLEVDGMPVVVPKPEAMAGGAVDQTKLG